MLELLNIACEIAHCPFPLLFGLLLLQSEKRLAKITYCGSLTTSQIAETEEHPRGRALWGSFQTSESFSSLQLTGERSSWI